MKKRDPERVTYEIETPEAEDRLRNLILYIAAKCATDKYFGRVKLNKILYWSDLHAFAVRGEPITGGEYLADKLGPVPRRMPSVRDRMLARHEIVEQIRIVGGGYTEKRLVATEEPDLSRFSGAEIAIIDSVIEGCRKKTARDVSWRSHGRAWRIARKAQIEIPYEAVFLSDSTKPSEYQRARGMELIRQYGWGA